MDGVAKKTGTRVFAPFHISMRMARLKGNLNEFCRIAGSPDRRIAGVAVLR